MKAADAIARSLREIVVAETRIAKNSYARFVGIGKPLAWNDDAWRLGDERHFLMIRRARRALEAYDATKRRASRTTRSNSGIRSDGAHSPSPAPWARPGGSVGMRGSRLRVYAIRGWRNELLPKPNGSRQSRELVAARSKTEARGLFAAVNYGSAPPLSEVIETGNAGEIAVATAQPGVVFFRSIDAREAEAWIVARRNVKALAREAPSVAPRRASGTGA